jgi:hypothetical protein
LFVEKKNFFFFFFFSIFGSIAVAAVQGQWETTMGNNNNNGTEEVRTFIFVNEYILGSFPGMTGFVVGLYSLNTTANPMQWNLAIVQGANVTNGFAQEMGLMLSASIFKVNDTAIQVASTQNDPFDRPTSFSDQDLDLTVFTRTGNVPSSLENLFSSSQSSSSSQAGSTSESGSTSSTGGSSSESDQSSSRQKKNRILSTTLFLRLKSD